MHGLERRWVVVCFWGCASALWACSSTEGTPPDEPATALGAGLGGTSNASEPPTPSLAGTQTGGEGDAPYCGEGPPNWVPVPETIPFPTRYTGQLAFDGGGSAPTELTLSNLGSVYALELNPSETVHSMCGEGRQGELDWDLNVAGALRVGRAGGADRVVYSAGFKGELGDTFELSDVALERDPPTPDDFRAASSPAPWAPGEGPVRVDVYIHVGDVSADIELRWHCWPCGSSRVALPLASGTLAADSTLGSPENRRDPPEL